MHFLFGKSLSPERFEELNKRVSRREELIYQSIYASIKAVLLLLGR
jgi:hypothetical protein